MRYRTAAGSLQASKARMPTSAGGKCGQITARTSLKSADQYLKHLEVVGYCDGPQAMIKRVLSECALCSVEGREHGVEVQIVPGTTVQRCPVTHVGQAGAVGLGDCLHLSLATNRLAPSVADLCE